MTTADTLTLSALEELRADRRRDYVFSDAVEDLDSRFWAIAAKVGGQHLKHYTNLNKNKPACYAIKCLNVNTIRCVEAAAVAGVLGASVDHHGKDAVVYWTHLRVDTFPHLDRVIAEVCV